MASPVTWTFTAWQVSSEKECPKSNFYKRQEAKAPGRVKAIPASDRVSYLSYYIGQSSLKMVEK